MAFTKSISTRGTTGGYLKIIGYRWDDMSDPPEASALFALYVDKAHADRCKPSVPPGQRDQPLVAIAAKLRLRGPAFEQYVGRAVLSESASEGGTDVLAHLYAAAKEISRERKRTGKPVDHAHVASDFGADLFADAKAV